VSTNAVNLTNLPECTEVFVMILAFE